MALVLPRFARTALGIALTAGALVVAGTSPSLAAVSSPTPGNISAVSAGGFQSLAVRSDGTVWAWGANGSGELGDGTTTDRRTPVQVSGLTDAVAVSGGGYFSLALRSDGTVWAWGYNHDGQLGDGTTTTRTTPVQVSGLTDVVSISAGQAHSLAVRSNGSAWAWGDNQSGQLGDGTTVDRLTPVQVSGLTKVAAVSASRCCTASGEYFSLAVRTNGTAWSWGDNGYGQLGDGTSDDRHVPGRVVGLGDVAVVGLTAGTFHGVAVRSDGSVFSWGHNGYGQLGDGTQVGRTTPGEVVGLSGIASVGAGKIHSQAVGTDGTAWAWGSNQQGRLGDGTHRQRRTPVAVKRLSGVTVLSGGWGHSLALRDNGTVWGWGWNAAGQVGDGTPRERLLRPVRVVGLDAVAVPG